MISSCLQSSISMSLRSITCAKLGRLKIKITICGLVLWGTNRQVHPFSTVHKALRARCCNMIPLKPRKTAIILHSPRMRRIPKATDHAVTSSHIRQTFNLSKSGSVKQRLYRAPLLMTDLDYQMPTFFQTESPSASSVSAMRGSNCTSGSSVRHSSSDI